MKNSFSFLLTVAAFILQMACTCPDVNGESSSQEAPGTVQVYQDRFLDGVPGSEELEKLPHGFADRSHFLSLIKFAEPKPIELQPNVFLKRPIWKGGFTVVDQLGPDGIRHFDISSYGGFFRVLEEPGIIYYIPSSLVDRWHEEVPVGYRKSWMDWKKTDGE